jgi:hypothetical protein
MSDTIHVTWRYGAAPEKEQLMNNIIWLVGAVVIVLFILGYFGLR